MSTITMKSFLARQLDSVNEIQNVTGTIPLYGLINEVLLDVFSEEEIARRGQGNVSTQRRVANYVKRIFNHVVVPNKFVNDDNNWSLDSYTIVNESDVEDITLVIRDLVTQ